jgi:hypothetical protein
MVKEYSTHVCKLQSDGVEIKGIKNLIVNPTKDLAIVQNNGRLVRLGKLFPTFIREMQDEASCIHWIEQMQVLHEREDMERRHSSRILKQPHTLRPTYIRHRGTLYRIEEQLVIM